MGDRPPMIGNVADLASSVGEGDLQASAAALGRDLGLERLGVNHETLPPGCRSSMPHAHSHEEELVFVVSGCPDLWVDGELHRLRPGDAAAFPAGTGIAHCLINNTEEDVQFLVVGEKDALDSVIFPVNPERKPHRPWTDAPRRPLGGHDGNATKT